MQLRLSLLRSCEGQTKETSSRSLTLQKALASLPTQAHFPSMSRKKKNAVLPFIANSCPTHWKLSVRFIPRSWDGVHFQSCYVSFCSALLKFEHHNLSPWELLCREHKLRSRPFRQFTEIQPFVLGKDHPAWSALCHCKARMRNTRLSNTLWAQASNFQCHLKHANGACLLIIILGGCQKTKHASSTLQKCSFSLHIFSL